MNNVPEVTPQQLEKELQEGAAPVLLDVREDDELEISRMEGIVHIPMHDIPARMSELEPEADIVVICRTGGRSAQVTAFLQRQGFAKVRNLVGGMNRWATEIDPSLPTY
ncbi:MAG: rhodanese-like domain-containing protein [Fimbriimonas sp.]